MQNKLPNEIVRSEQSQGYISPGGITACKSTWSQYMDRFQQRKSPKPTTVRHGNVLANLILITIRPSWACFCIQSQQKP